MKKLSENRLWDIYKKSSGLEQRKEDILKPFFGEGIEYKFYEENGRKNFRYDEIYDILKKKNPGWRIPTWDDFEKVADKNHIFNRNSPLAASMMFNDVTSDEKYTVIHSTCGGLKIDRAGEPFSYIWYSYDGTLNLKLFYITTTYGQVFGGLHHKNSLGMILLLRDKNK